MELLKVHTMAEARDKLIEKTSNKEFHTERINIIHGFGRVLAEDVFSPIMVPDFRRSTVDGYAVNSADTWGADDSTPVFLEMVEDIEVGTAPKKAIKPGECSYVPTGGMLPIGADGMVMVEYSEEFAKNSIAIYTGASKGSCIVEIGEDVKEGELVLKKGTLLNPGEVATLASLGIIEVLAYKKPTITIISTGDELATPGEEKREGQVYEINSYGLYGMAKKNGFEIKSVSAVNDEEELLASKIREGMESSDFVIVSGGSSQGKHDLTKKVMDKLSNPGVFVHGLAFKPGKPTILGYDETSEAVLIGLPGHPVAAMVIFELVILWYYRQKLGLEPKISIPAIFESNIPSAPGRETCQLVQLIKGEKGYIARPILGKSGLISTLTRGEGYVIIDRNKEGLFGGEEVEVYLL